MSVWETWLKLKFHVQLGQPRDDYLELLELSIIFVGGKPLRGVSFMLPGPMSSARWMAKGIYALKMFLFRHQIEYLTEEEKDGLLQICIFIVQAYIQVKCNF